jgi:formylglycine-generating enzyme required for sulfatase activity
MVRVAIASLLLLLVLPSAAHAEARIALVITNQAYTQSGARLTNTHRDGDVVKAALEKVGFKVWVAKDTTNERSLLEAVAQHVQRLAEAGPDAVGFFYYSGHGAADRPNGENFLIPTDVPLTHVAQLPLLAVRLEKITSTLATAGRMSFVVFDACRNVPLQRADKDLAFKGFAPVREQNGLLVAFATEPGNVAVDQSLYAKALAEELVKPGLEAAQVFRRVRLRVREDTRQTQSPEYLDKRDNDFHFQRVPSAPAQPQISEAERAWRWVKNTTDQSALENFINEFGGTTFGDEAKVRLAELKKQQVAIAAPPKAPAPVPTRPAQPAEAVPPISNLGRCDDGVAEWFAGSPPIRRCLKPKDTFKDCETCPEMVVAPAGDFMMGSPWNEESREDDEGPQRKVTIAKPFAVGKFEVTFAEWDTCVAERGCKHWPGDEGWGRGTRPVINVSWDDIKKEYLPWLSRKTGKVYRLLTEAEWEYAARAGTSTPFSTGQTITTEQANFDGNYTYGGSGKGQYRQKTVNVGSLQPNAFGLYEMRGNVWEWLEDCYHDSYRGAPTDGSAWTTTNCGRRVVRGGSWSSYPRDLRAADRFGNSPGFRVNGSGFRLARTLTP